MIPLNHCRTFQLTRSRAQTAYEGTLTAQKPQARRPCACRDFWIAASAAMTYLSFDYEVFGKVQGVFFRSSTVDEAKKLGVVGWVANTSSGTVQGQVQGKPDAAAKMKTFLQEKGSPHSRIDKTNITNEKDVKELGFKDFQER